MNGPHITRAACVIKRIGPKAYHHQNVGRPCIACGVPLVVGDYTALIDLGPGGDPEQQRKAYAGIAFQAVAAEIHWACAAGR